MDVKYRSVPSGSNGVRYCHTNLLSLYIVSYGFWFKGEFREGWSRHALKGDTGHADPKQEEKEEGKIVFQ
jgi:hypothetical protein